MSKLGDGKPAVERPVMRRTRRPYAATASAAALLLLLPGCGGDGGSGAGRGSASTSGGAGVLDERQVTGAVLAPDSLSAGWETIERSVTTLAGDVPTDLRTRDRNCKKLFDALGGHLGGHRARTNAARDYRKGKRGPYLSSEVASYEGTDAIRTVSTFKSVRDSCTRFRAKHSAVVVVFTVSPLKGAFVGEDSPGVRLRGKAEGGPADGSRIALDLVLARAGQSTTGVAVLSTGDGDAGLTADAAKTALNRLQRTAAGKTPFPTVPGDGAG